MDKLDAMRLASIVIAVICIVGGALNSAIARQAVEQHEKDIMIASIINAVLFYVIAFILVCLNFVISKP